MEDNDDDSTILRASVGITMSIELLLYNSEIFPTVHFTSVFPKQNIVVRLPSHRECFVTSFTEDLKM